MSVLALVVAAAVTQVPQELAPCKFVESSVFVFNEDCDDCLKVKEVTIAGERRYQVYALSYGMGRDASFTETYWLVNPRSCEAVGLEIEGGGGHPVSASVFVSSSKGVEASAEQQQYLLDASGFVAGYSTDPRDQLASSAPGRWVTGEPKPQRNSYAPMKRELESSSQTCPCYRFFAGSSFEKKQTLELNGSKLHLYATSARNQSWAFALERKGQTLWGTLGGRSSVKTAKAKGKSFVLDTVRGVELEREVVEIDSASGKQTTRKR